MTGLQATRWTRYGKDRVYVRTSVGDDVGYIDLVTRAITMSDERFAAEFAGLAAQWLGDEQQQTEASTTGSPAPSAAALPPPRLAPAPPPPELDLALGAAGDAARAQRNRVYRQAPVRNTVARILGVKTEERNWRIGAEGEEKVGAVLRGLSNEWSVIHAVPVGDRGSDIDHVVIGPGGVFTLNTKCHPGANVWVAERAMKVNGQSVPYLRNSRFEAARASKLLSQACGWPVSVHPVVVVVEAERFTLKAQPADVSVVTRREVRDWLEARPRSLHSIQVEQVAAFARVKPTWQSSASESQDS